MTDGPNQRVRAVRQGASVRVLPSLMPPGLAEVYRRAKRVLRARCRRLPGYQGPRLCATKWWSAGPPRSSPAPLPAAISVRRVSSRSAAFSLIAKKINALDQANGIPVVRDSFAAVSPLADWDPPPTLPALRCFTGDPDAQGLAAEALRVLHLLHTLQDGRPAFASYTGRSRNPGLRPNSAKRQSRAAWHAQ